jgi:D-glycero-alpha-D-manno-heptose-7-phosphate kinase
MYAYCTIEPRNDGKIAIFARDMNEVFECESKPSLEVDGQLILHKGIYNRIVKNYNSGHPLSLI